MTTWARGQTRKPVHSPAMAIESMATLNKKKNIFQETGLLSEHLEEPPALLAVPGGQLQHSGDEAQAAGDHRPLHHVQLRQDDEDEQGKADNVHRLEDEYNKKVGERGTAKAAGLVQAVLEDIKECEELGEDEGEEEAPCPDSSLRGVQLSMVLPIHATLIIVAAVFY